MKNYNMYENDFKKVTEMFISSKRLCLLKMYNTFEPLDWLKFSYEFIRFIELNKNIFDYPVKNIANTSVILMNNEITFETCFICECYWEVENNPLPSALQLSIIRLYNKYITFDKGENNVVTAKVTGKDSEWSASWHSD